MALTRLQCSAVAAAIACASDGMGLHSDWDCDCDCIDMALGLIPWDGIALGFGIALTWREGLTLWCVGPGCFGWELQDGDGWQRVGRRPPLGRNNLHPPVRFQGQDAHHQCRRQRIKVRCDGMSMPMSIATQRNAMPCHAMRLHLQWDGMSMQCQ